MNQRGYINIIFAVLVIVLAGAVGYFVLRKPATEPTNNQTTPSLQTQTANNVPVASQSNSETANWKTYNFRNIYSIKYPIGWYTTYGGETLAISNNPFLGERGFPAIEDINIYITNWGPVEKGENLKSWAYKSGLLDNLLDRQDVTLGNLEAVKGKKSVGGSRVNGEPRDNIEVVVLIVLNDREYEITYEPYNSQLSNVFYQILSTLQPID